MLLEDPRFKPLNVPDLQRLTVKEFILSKKPHIRLVLDNIRSAYNVGAIFRSADAFGIDFIHICGISPEPSNIEVKKTALGADLSIAWEKSDQEEAFNQLVKDGYKVACLEQTTNSILMHEFTASENEKWALVLGNEVRGVSEFWLNRSDIALEIAQWGTKASLNVAVAAGVSLYHFRNIMAKNCN